MMLQEAVVPAAEFDWINSGLVNPLDCKYLDITWHSNTVLRILFGTTCKIMRQFSLPDQDEEKFVFKL